MAKRKGGKHAPQDCSGEVIVSESERKRIAYADFVLRKQKELLREGLDVECE